MMLKAFDAIAACRFAGRAAVIPRQVDSCAQLELLDTRESAIVRSMQSADTLPTDIVALHAMIIAERATHAAAQSAIIAERDRLAARNARLESAHARLAEIVAEMKRARFGRKSERITDAQLALALEELEIAAATVEAQVEKVSPEKKADAAKKRRASRNENLDHLPHEEIVIEPEGGTTCPCCSGTMHVIGEDRSKPLDKIPAKLTVLVTRRPKYACRTCEKTGADDVAGIVQAPAPPRLIEGGLPTEALVADVVVSKHADHMPRYRQS